MPSGALTVEAYARQLKQLLPPGRLWLLEPGTLLSKALEAISVELARIDARGDALIDETDPRTVLETLDDWERMLGLPDSCMAEAPDSISERRVAILQKFTSRGGQSRQFFIDLAASLGYTVTISEYAVLRAGFLAGDLCNGDAWAYAWLVNISVAALPPGVDPGFFSNATVFRAGSRAGQRLAGFGQLDLQCIFLRVAPAHTVVLFAFV